MAFIDELMAFRLDPIGPVWVHAGITPLLVFKKLANFDEILTFLNVLGPIETLVNFLMS